MAELKTQKNSTSVEAFLDSIHDEKRRKDGYELLKIFKEATNQEPNMWGDSIIGFGSYHYKYESGREGDWMLTGFSPRKQNLSLYIMSGFVEFDHLLEKLGPHKTGKACLYIKHVADIDRSVLKRLIRASIRHLKHESYVISSSTSQ